MKKCIARRACVRPIDIAGCGIRSCADREENTMTKRWTMSHSAATAPASIVFISNGNTSQFICTLVFHRKHRSGFAFAWTRSHGEKWKWNAVKTPGTTEMRGSQPNVINVIFCYILLRSPLYFMCRSGSERSGIVCTVCVVRSNGRMNKIPSLLCGCLWPHLVPSTQFVRLLSRIEPRTLPTFSPHSKRWECNYL